MRYFYSDALEATYMAQYFQVGFERGFESIYLVDSPPGRFKDISKELVGKLYIHPDSLKILEPQEGDLGLDINKMPVSYSSGSWISYNYGDDGVKGIKIIQRNGKLFFWPESE